MKRSDMMAGAIAVLRSQGKVSSEEDRMLAELLTDVAGQLDDADAESARLRAELAEAKLIRHDPDDWATTVKDARSWFGCTEAEAEEWCDKPHRQALAWFRELAALRAELAKQKAVVESLRRAVAFGTQPGYQELASELAELRTAAQAVVDAEAVIDDMVTGLNSVPAAIEAELAVSAAVQALAVVLERGN